jgi:DNA topoisomerase IB
MEVNYDKLNKAQLIALHQKALEDLEAKETQLAELAKAFDELQREAVAQMRQAQADRAALTYAVGEVTRTAILTATSFAVPVHGRQKTE